MKNTYYHPKTPERVQEILESCSYTNKRVRLFFGDAAAGTDWGEEYDVTGTIERSMGSNPVWLLLPICRSFGGEEILDHCIVRILIDGREVYRHPLYNQPAYIVGKPPAQIGNTNMQQAGYTHGVYANAVNVANFKSEKAARRWIDFMTGERMGK